MRFALRRGVNSIHEGHRQRLRESFYAQGADAFHDHQLLELLLTFSVPRRDTNETAHRLLDVFGSLNNVFSANLFDLRNIPGVGIQSALLISLVGALMRRSSKPVVDGDRLDTPALAAAYCMRLLGDKKYETLYVISLDKNLKVLYADCISSGTLTETAVYPRLVVESALRHRAHSVIITHNHPSGNVMPSPEDISSTMQILKALEMIGIRLHDHIITGKGTSFSMVRDSALSQTQSADSEDEIRIVASERKD